MAEALALLAVAHEAHGGHDEDGVEADDAEQRREDVVDEDVGEGRDGRRAPAHDGCRGLGRAGRVGDEGRGRAVAVPAAGELHTC